LILSLYPRRLFLFDLDGTLIDSREDISRCLNAVLARLKLPAMTTDKVLRYVGDGIEMLIRGALRVSTGIEPDEDQIAAGIRFMLDEYATQLVVHSSLYPGVRETLASLGDARFAVISNKNEDLSRRILAEFGLADQFCIILGGNSLPRRKPDPEPLREAMLRCGATPGETVMVGDSPTDILAGKAAGVITCGVTYGFRTREDLQAAGADIIVDSFPDLLKHFRV
jgi:phosphoglycolate phosphatase